jgi:ankyrin repeat protein
LMQAIAAGDEPEARALLQARPTLALAAIQRGATRAESTENYLAAIGCYVYAGDTALHVAAAAHRPDQARLLLDLGADVGAKNRRKAQPLHYAAVGAPGSTRWNPDAQAATIAVLTAAGADPNAADMNGVTPLHRAVRTRCAAAVRALLKVGADPGRRNSNGSTPMLLASRATGRGGSSSPEAKAEQAMIVRALTDTGVTL